jgi:DNA-binding response OmpR family regulator
VLDHWLPDITGDDLCRKLREFDRLTPILFYSGAAYESDKARAMAAGAQGYVVKPADPDELVSEILRLIHWEPLQFVLDAAYSTLISPILIA